MKKGTTVDFYTPEQIEELRVALEEKTYSTFASLSRALGKKWNRSPRALCQKIYNISNKLNGKQTVNYKAKYRAKKTADNKPAAIVVQPEVGVELPKGMTFEGTPKKVILYKDHFRVYL